MPPEIARKVAAPRLTPENAAILDRIRATAGTSHLRADLQGGVTCPSAQPAHLLQVATVLVHRCLHD